MKSHFDLALLTGGSSGIGLAVAPIGWWPKEHLTMPEETRKINGTAGCKEPEEIAVALMRGLKNRRFVILPGFMSKVTWYLYRWMPSLVHHVIDSDVRKVRKRYRF